jgi:hypothetical protein
MAQQEGPFSEYLQMAKMTPQVQVPQPTGLEGSGAAIGNIAMNFINGLRQGRMQKYAMQQMEEQKKFDAYQDAIKTVAASDLPDADKQRLSTQLSMPLIQRIAGDKQATSKETGNPLTDVLKNMAVGLVGGQAPKKSMELPMDPVVEALRASSDPSRSKTRMASQYEAKIRDRINTIFRDNPYAESRDVLSDPEISSIQKEAEGVFGVGKFQSPSLEKTYKELTAVSPSEKIKMDTLRQFLGIGKPTTEGAVSTAVIPGVAPVGVPTPQGPSATQAPPGMVQGGIPLPQRYIDQAATVAQTTGFPLYKESTTTEEFETPDGERLAGKNISVNVGGRVVSGIYDANNQILYPISSLKRIKPGGGTSKEVQLAYDDIREQVNKALAGVSGAVKDSLMAEAEAARRTGDIKALKDLPQRATKMLVDIDKEKASEARQNAIFSHQDEMAAKRFSQQEELYNRRAVTNAANGYRRDPIVRALDQVDAQIGGVESAFKLKQYLQNPNSVKMERSDFILLDKSLARAASKITDPTTGVKQTEEEGYNNLKNVVEALKVKINSVLTTEGSTLGDYATRRSLYNLIKNIQGSLKQKADSVKKEYRGFAVGAPPEMLDAAFGETTAAPPTPEAGGGKVPPRNRGARVGQGDQTTKQPADI